MSISCSRSSPSALFVALLFIASCSSGPTRGEWRPAEGTQTGGFTVMMPAPNGVQQGTLVLLGDSIESHLFLATDSGITYTAAYLDLPPSLAQATDSARAAAIWAMLTERLGAPPLPEPPPLGPPTGTVQSAWFVDRRDVRLAAVVHLRGTRIVLLNSAVPEAMFGSAQRDKMLKFLRSIAFTG